VIQDEAVEKKTGSSRVSWKSSGAIAPPKAGLFLKKAIWEHKKKLRHRKRVQRPNLDRFNAVGGGKGRLKGGRIKKKKEKKKQEKKKKKKKKKTTKHTQVTQPWEETAREEIP